MVNVDDTAHEPTETQVRTAIATQVGTISQLPPDYSALKVGGKRAYDLARAGEAVELKPRPVRIDRVTLLEYRWPRLELEIECGGGTYIRSIARDVGDLLGCGGLVDVLVRTRIGPFTQADALDPTTLSAESIPRLLRPALEAADALPRVTLSSAQMANVAQGRSLTLDAFPGVSHVQGEVALIGPDGRLAAIGEFVPGSGLISPRRVLVGSDPTAIRNAP